MTIGLLGAVLSSLRNVTSTALFTAAGLRRYASVTCW